MRGCKLGRVGWECACGHLIVSYSTAVLPLVFVVLCAGSENNRCFVFEKSFGKPLLEYKFNTSRSLLV